MSVTALWQQVTVDAWRERLMPIERWNYLLRCSPDYTLANILMEQSILL